MEAQKAMDPETKKAAEFCQIAGVGHVVASRPPLKPIERYRTADREPELDVDVLTAWGLCRMVQFRNKPVWVASDDQYSINGPTWWAYMPEGDE